MSYFKKKGKNNIFKLFLEKSIVCNNLLCVDIDIYMFVKVLLNKLIVIY